MNTPRRDTARHGLAAGLALLLVLGACSSPPRRSYPPTPAPLPVPSAPGAGNVPDATPRAEPRSAHGNPPFYEVAGRRYQVLASAEGHVERGVASWYGPDFHGHNTSSGEPYDMYAMTAAHKTLPLPCYARITNLSNGRSIVVRINDRGPFVANRIVDLSYSAALKLDVVRTGTALVELRTVGPADGLATAATASASPPSTPTGGSSPHEATPPPAVTSTPMLYIQVGAYGDAGNAQRVLGRLKDAGIATAFALAGSGRGQHLTRVRVGPIGSVEQFDATAAQLASLGFPDARLASD